MASEIKDLIGICAIVFAAGGLWQLVKTLKDNLKELQIHGVELQKIVTSHETRITILEIPVKRARGRR